MDSIQTLSIKSARTLPIQTLSQAENRPSFKTRFKLGVCMKTVHGSILWVIIGKALRATFATLRCPRHRMTVGVVWCFNFIYAHPPPKLTELIRKTTVRNNRNKVYVGEPTKG